MRDEKLPLKGPIQPPHQLWGPHVCAEDARRFNYLIRDREAERESGPPLSEPQPVALAPAPLLPHLLHPHAQQPHRPATTLQPPAAYPPNPPTCPPTNTHTHLPAAVTNSRFYPPITPQPQQQQPPTPPQQVKRPTNSSKELLLMCYLCLYWYLFTAGICLLVSVGL